MRNARRACGERRKHAVPRGRETARNPLTDRDCLSAFGRLLDRKDREEGSFTDGVGVIRSWKSPSEPTARVKCADERPLCEVGLEHLLRQRSWLRQTSSSFYQVLYPTPPSNTRPPYAQAAREADKLMLIIREGNHDGLCTSSFASLCSVPPVLSLCT
jgi:hypothetical protein